MDRLSNIVVAVFTTIFNLIVDSLKGAFAIFQDILTTIFTTEFITIIIIALIFALIFFYLPRKNKGGNNK